MSWKILHSHHREVKGMGGWIHSMTVPMVQIGIMRMEVEQRFVSMPVAVWLTRRISRAMRVRVMFVVDVTMIVL